MANISQIPLQTRFYIHIIVSYDTSTRIYFHQALGITFKAFLDSINSCGQDIESKSNFSFADSDAIVSEKPTLER